MKTRICVAIILLSVTLLLANGPQGTEPRSAATRYPAHSEISSVALGASRLSADQARKGFVSDINRCCIVVEVALYPSKGKPVNVSLNDFVLRIKDTDVVAKPSSAKVIAASLQKKARSDRDVTVYPSYGVTYQSGHGCDPVTGTQGSGVTQTTGVVVGIGPSGSNPASTDKDRSVMETELSRKASPKASPLLPLPAISIFLSLLRRRILRISSNTRLIRTGFCCLCRSLGSGAASLAQQLECGAKSAMTLASISPYAYLPRTFVLPLPKNRYTFLRTCFTSR